jgi:hypothetical protein
MGKTPVPSNINFLVLDESYENINNEFKNLRSKKQLIETRNMKSQKYYDMVNRLKDKIQKKSQQNINE